MTYTIEVRVGLKKGVMDAEGETVAKSLALLGYPVQRVATVKCYEVEVEAETADEALARMREASEKLLANPVVNEYSLAVKKG